MLEKPDFPDENIIACVQEAYDLAVQRLTFLPLGADVNTAVYKITTEQTAYFLKLRRGAFDEMSVALPKFLSELGISPIIPPLPTVSGRLWADLPPFKTILYPYIEGQNGYEITLNAQSWHEFGVALRQIHTTPIPAEFNSSLWREVYAGHGRKAVLSFLETLIYKPFRDAVARQTAVFLQDKKQAIIELIQRTEQLAQVLCKQSLPFVICHSDLHAGNLLISHEGKLYLVDWDEPILAPKERDLMYIGGGLLASGLMAQEEEALFYAAYGQVQVNQTAVAYYRYERIIQDILAYCEELLLTEAGGADRPQSLRYLMSNFSPNGTIEIAYQSARVATNGE
ncbi:MAG: aminoglycoside phosphotransferase family protein [Anaerolineales bacterium]|nr:aminoglycoside phosphotransferase family protein [Anaerolineales bacterium]